MAWNRGENDEQVVKPEVVAEPVAPEVSGEVAPEGSRGATREAIEPEIVLTPEEQRQLDLLRMYRNRMHDLSDERFERLIEALRERQSVKSIARGIVEEGLCAHLRPKTVVIYVTKIRESLGLPGYMDQVEQLEQIAEEESDEPIEGEPARRRLQWLARIQQARVRKAIKMEGMMGGMVLPQATTEIKLMTDIVDKEMDVALKTGEMKQEPTKVEVTATNDRFADVTPAEAYRVLLAYQKAMKLGKEILDAADANTEGE